MRREIEEVKESSDLLIKMSDNGENTVYDGFENRVYRNTRDDAGVFVLYPRIVPSAKIIYFPKVAYLVSATITYRSHGKMNKKRENICNSIFGYV